MRYRMLSDDELQALSEDFTQFLVVQGIDDDTWRKINKEDREKALKIVEVFSDTVLFKVYSKIKFMSYISEKVFSVFKINKTTIDLILIKSIDPQLVFKDESTLYDLLNLKPAAWELYSSSKKLGDKLTDEIHKLSAQGCQVTSKEIWEELSKFHKKASKKASF